MCTLTWFRHDGGYELFYNRDERYERAPALGLRRGARAGIEHLAPIDGEAGGTWLGVNAFGLTAALLNRYPEGRVDEPPDVLWRSRGEVALDVLGARSPDSVVEIVQAGELARTRPFTLVVLAHEREPLRCAWDGEVLSVDRLGDADLPITSAPDELARTSRSAAFDALRVGGIGPAVLERYHAGHEPARGPLSVCLHGKRSGSRSFGHVRVALGKARFRYRDRPPCEGGPDEVLELDLARSD